MLDEHQPAPAIDEDALDLLDTYIKDSIRQIEELQRAYAAGDLTNTHRLAHSMKSSSATFGALGLSECCERLEYSAKDNCAGGTCERELQRVVEERARVIESLTCLQARFGE